MFSSIITAGALTPSSILICSVAAVLLGGILALAYMNTGRYSRNFPIALVLLPVMVQMVIMMVNGNLGAGVAVAGAFSLVRFRSLPGSSKEIVSIFFAMAVGLATGMGYVGYAAIFAVTVSALMVILYKSGFALPKQHERVLRVTIPEELSYEEVLDDILEAHTKRFELDRIKTTNLGSMFELSYKIELQDEKATKSLIDEIRVRNANLPIILSRSELDKGMEL